MTERQRTWLEEYDFIRAQVRMRGGEISREPRMMAEYMCSRAALMFDEGHWEAAVRVFRAARSIMCGSMSTGGRESYGWPYAESVLDNVPRDQVPESDPCITVDDLLARVRDFNDRCTTAVRDGRWERLGKVRQEFKTWCIESGLNIEFPREE